MVQKSLKCPLVNINGHYHWDCDIVDSLWCPQSNVPDDMRCFPGTSAWKGSDSAFGRVKTFLSLGILKHWPPIRLLLLTEKSFLDMGIATNWSSATIGSDFKYYLIWISPLGDKVFYEWKSPSPSHQICLGWVWVQHGSPWGLKEPTALWPCQIPSQYLSQMGQAAILVLQETLLCHLHVPPTRLENSPNPTVMQQQTALDGCACKRGFPSFFKIWLVPWDHGQVYKTTHETTKQVPHLPKWFCGVIFPAPLNRSSVCSG